LLQEELDDTIEVVIVLFGLNDVCDLEVGIVTEVGMLIAVEDLISYFVHLIVFEEVVGAFVFVEVVDHFSHQGQHVSF
jgi:hypothetical protein